MDMAPQHEVFGAAPARRPQGGGLASGRALDALRDATQAAMMMAMVWPVIAAMPFFWAPPVWIMTGMIGGSAK